MPLRIRSHITYPQKPKPVEVVKEKRNPIANVLFGAWKPEEDAVLVSSYKTLGPSKIGERLGRSPGAVTQRYLKIRDRTEQPKVFVRWDEKEKAIIRRYYKEIGAKAVASMLDGRTERAVQNCARIIGVTGASNGT